jgi:hypothetical protein
VGVHLFCLRSGHWRLALEQLAIPTYARSRPARGSSRRFIGDMNSIATSPGWVLGGWGRVHVPYGASVLAPSEIGELRIAARGRAKVLRC